MNGKVSDKRNVLKIRLKGQKKNKQKGAQGHKVLEPCTMEMQIFRCRSQDRRGSGKWNVLAEKRSNKFCVQTCSPRLPLASAAARPASTGWLPSLSRVSAQTGSPLVDFNINLHGCVPASPPSSADLLFLKWNSSQHFSGLIGAHYHHLTNWDLTRVMIHLVYWKINSNIE